MKKFEVGKTYHAEQRTENDYETIKVTIAKRTAKTITTTGEDRIQIYEADDREETKASWIFMISTNEVN